jgi:hypothetical protein
MTHVVAAVPVSTISTPAFAVLDLLALIYLVLVALMVIAAWRARSWKRLIGPIASSQIVKWLFGLMAAGAAGSIVGWCLASVTLLVAPFAPFVWRRLPAGFREPVEEFLHRP